MLGSSLMFRNSLCQSLAVHPWQRGLTLILSLSHQGGRKSAGVDLQVHIDSRKKVSQGDGIPDVLQSLTSSAVQIDTLPEF